MSPDFSQQRACCGNVCTIAKLAYLSCLRDNLCVFGSCAIDVTETSQVKTPREGIITRTNQLYFAKSSFNIVNKKPVHFSD